MSFEKGKTGIGSTITAQYGPRKVGNGGGNLPSAGARREVAFNFDGDTFDEPVTLPKGAIVVGYNLVNTTGTLGLITATYDDTTTSALKAATDAVPVVLTADAKISVTGITAGTVIVRYIQLA